MSFTKFVLKEDYSGYKKGTGFTGKIEEDKTDFGTQNIVVVKLKDKDDLKIPLGKISFDYGEVEKSKGEVAYFSLLRNWGTFSQGMGFKGKIINDGKMQFVYFKDNLGIVSRIPYSGENSDILKKSKGNIINQEQKRNENLPISKKVERELKSMGSPKKMPPQEPNNTESPQEPNNPKSPEIAKAEVKTEPQSEGGLFANKKLVYGVIGVIAVIGIIGALKYKKVI